jgi:hypothetical protein
VKQEKLVAALPAAPKAASAATAPAPAKAGAEMGDERAISLIARQEHGDEIDGAAEQAQAGIEAKDAALAEQKSDAAAQTAAQIAEAEQQSADEQASQRAETLVRTWEIHLRDLLIRAVQNDR